MEVESKVKTQYLFSRCSAALFTLIHEKMASKQAASWFFFCMQSEKGCLMFRLSEADIIMPQPASSIFEYSTSLTSLHLTSIQL